MEGKFDRRIRSQREREIYRPGSGPLKRTEPQDSKPYCKNDTSERLNYSKNGRDHDTDRGCFENPAFQKYDHHDRRKSRKPDAGIYVPKQNRGPEDDSDYGTTSQPNYFNKPDKLMTRERCINRGSEPDSRYEQSSKQPHRGNRTEIPPWEPVKENLEMRKFDNKSHDSRTWERGVYTNSNIDRGSGQHGQHHGEQKSGSYFNRFDHRDRGGGNDKNRSGRNTARSMNSNTLTLPDMFNNLPPRLQKQHLQKEGLSPEEIEKYLNDLKIMPTTNRDNRYPQTLPPKNNRNSHFKMNKHKEPPIRGSRVFHQKSRYSESSDSGTPVMNSNQKSLPPYESKSLCQNTENWARESVHEREKVPLENDTQQEKHSDESSSDEERVLDDPDDEVINWAEEVEREQQNAERNSREANDENNDKKRDRRKRRRREFRKKRGFSYERKEPQRTRNTSEGEYEQERVSSNSGSGYSKNTNESGSDGYLSWRRHKAPSPPRNRLNIGNKNYRTENAFDNRNNSGSSQPYIDRLSNKSKIIHRINDLPMAIRDQAASLDKEHIAGIIKLPQTQTTQSSDRKCPPPVFPQPQHLSTFSNKPIKQLYNPTNPKQPIIGPSQSSRVAIPSLSPASSHYTAQTPTDQPYVPVFLDPNVSAIVTPAAYVSDQYVMSRPAWYDAYSESFRSTFNAHLLLDISRADTELQTLLLPGAVFHNWERISELRIFLQEALKTLLTHDLKFCEAENVEQHMWKILFHNVIELLRKCMYEDTTNAFKYKNLLSSVLDEGNEYFRSLLSWLEREYEIKIDDFLLIECPSTKTRQGLALISAQKIFLFLGDLARYKENSEQSSSYTTARQWYVKANQLIPRNGRPYNQLAILAVYGRKKFDAVYYYMRSLMASNPFFTARDSLLALFDENRKKYEQVEKERRELKEQKKQEKAKEKESVINGSMLRKETWIRPDDGRRIQRTTSTSQEYANDSDADELSALSAIEIYKRFLLSFLHVHGKLFSKVGMETLVEAAMEMLKEFKALLAYSPLPIQSTRLIQLLALNMFAIDNGQLKDPTIESGGYHSAVQESALVISLQMFNLIINRCIQLLRQQLQQMKDHEAAQKDASYPLIVGSDAQTLLPAIKLWCDWLFCHSAVWNPPPSCQDYRISGCGDCWSRLALLINILEELDYQEILRKNGYLDPILIMSDEKNDSVKITLEEDIALRGFTPLMCNDQQPVYTHKQMDMNLAQICLRIHRILFFGTMFLCGVDPPVLKLHKTDTGKSEYISVVEEGITPKNQSDNDENNEEKWSDSEDETVDKIDVEPDNRDDTSMTDDRTLLHRKKELERIQQKREKYMRDKKETINKEMAAFSVEMEIKPHYLVPDTNCFIDHLDELEKIAKAASAPAQRPFYSLMIPVVVLSELEGIARGAHKDEDVTERARYALNFLQNQCTLTNIKCVTTRGSVLPSTRFTSEEDYSKVEKNDDKILTTCLNLCKHSTLTNSTADSSKKIYREVVLLTEDRNLRVKALSSNMPVQTVTDFLAWAELN